MPRYSVFGSTLDSELELPDALPGRSRAPAEWRLRIATGPAPECGFELLGEHEVGRWGYRLLRAADRLRLEYATDYVFDLLEDGRNIVYHPGPSTTPEFARALLLGPVLALAHHLAGALCLHGSAVAVGNQGVAFLAAKYHGKSTLGLALTLAGARHLSDDAIVLERASPVRIRPGVQSVRLWDDSAARLAVDALRCRILRGVKNTVTGLPTRMLQRSPVPLAAVYVLTPVHPDGAQTAVERLPLPPSTAAIALTHHAKLAQALVGQEARGVQFRRAAEVAGSVPVYQLRVVRDFERLPEVVEAILSWHAVPDRPGARRLAPTPA